MNILLLGKGGREHALAWKLRQSKLVSQLYAMPGNPGIEQDGIECIDQDPLKFDKLITFCQNKGVNMVIVGPEAYLEVGVVDVLKKAGIPAIGPGREGTRLESSKHFAKTIMKECDIPTAEYKYFENYAQAKSFINSWPYANGLVIKADGLASGKGVFVCDTKDEALKSLDLLVKDNSLKLEEPENIVIEEKISGRELSAFALTDGVDYLYLGDACDYKRLYDEDQGPNTGGMGCYSPADWLTGDDRQFIKKRIFQKLFDRLKQKHIEFRGVLFAGLMKTADGIKVLEFNTRFGDPETQVILPRLECDLAQIFHACLYKKLNLVTDQLRLSNLSACHLVKASGGYPGISGEPMQLGHEITVDQRFAMLDEEKHKIFYAGVTKKGDKLVNTGGRVLGITVLEANREKAREKLYKIEPFVKFEGAQFRKDIAK